MASSYNFSVTQGSELSTRLTITNDDSPVNLSGFNVRGVVKHKYGDTGSLVDLNPTIVSGTTGSLYASGFVDIYFANELIQNISIYLRKLSRLTICPVSFSVLAVLASSELKPAGSSGLS